MMYRRFRMILNFISLFSETTDSKPMSQSPAYVISKFEQYLNTVDEFEFPKIERTESELKFIEEYMSIWKSSSYVSDDKFKNILSFIYRANWDSETLATQKYKQFVECIGDFNCIKSEDNCASNNGLHPLLGEWICRVEKKEVFRKDMDKLMRELNINSILKNV